MKVIFQIYFDSYLYYVDMEKASLQELRINIEGIELQGTLFVPDGSNGLVIFSHGSGSSRLSPRNKYVSSVLNKDGVATLLVDLLTVEEDSIYENRFDIELLTGRLIQITEWIQKEKKGVFKSVGYFGASTGAASALKAAARSGMGIAAIVSRGGRPDLAFEELRDVKAPTLLIVGGLDMDVLQLNREAFSQLRCIKLIQVVEGATHLFEEQGALEQVAELASQWFKKYLKKEI